MLCTKVLQKYLKHFQKRNLNILLKMQIFSLPNYFYYFYTMYKLDKTIHKAQTAKEAEKGNLFDATVSLGKRLEEAWILTAQAYGIDPLNPPKMEKTLFSTRKHDN
jgi:hypothetical protein